MPLFNFLGKESTLTQEEYNLYARNRQHWFDGKEKLEELDQATLEECEKEYNRKHSVYKRAMKHVKAFDSPFIYFGTLTFSNDMLNLSKDYRRKYVQQTLKSLGLNKYLACIDYGSKTAREHYHFVCGSEKAMPKLIRVLRIGNKNTITTSEEETKQLTKEHDALQENSILFKEVENLQSDQAKIMKYVSKVIYYTIKSQEKLIFSRGLDKHLSSDKIYLETEKELKKESFKVNRFIKRYHLKSIVFKPKNQVEILELKSRLKALQH